MRRPHAVHPDAPKIERDRVEVDLFGVRVHASEVERGRAEDALFRDVEGEIEGEVLDLKRPVAFEVAGVVGEGMKGAGAGWQGRRLEAPEDSW